jgi:ribosomal protein L40E
MSADFEQHKRMMESDPNRVRCAHCGAWVPARAERCPKCGVHFRGEAFQFEHPSDELAAARIARARRVRIAAIVIATLFAIGAIVFFVR